VRGRSLERRYGGCNIPRFAVEFEEVFQRIEVSAHATESSGPCQL